MIWVPQCALQFCNAVATLLWDVHRSWHEAPHWLASVSLFNLGAYIWNKALTISRTCSNPATNSSPTSNGLLNFSPSAIFHHSVRLKFELTDVVYVAWSSMLLSDATYVPGLLMSEKLWNVTLTGSGTSGKLPLDARRPVIQAAAS